MNSSSPRSVEHLDEALADFVLGRLTPFEHQRWVAHLTDCAPCREQVALAESMREDGVHLDAPRIVEIADDANAASSAEAAHLETCERCSGELEQMRTLEMPAELQMARSEPTPRGMRDMRGMQSSGRRAPARRLTKRTTSTSIAFFALAAMLLLLVFPRGDEQSLMSSFAQIEPLPVRITRSAGEPGSMEEARLLGLEAYRDQDWARAAEHLGMAHSRGATAEVGLYLASAQLLRGQDDAARAAVEAVFDDPEVSAGILDEARWLRVQLALRAEDPANVELWLTAIEAAQGRRAPDARALRGRMGGASE